MVWHPVLLLTALLAVGRTQEYYVTSRLTDCPSSSEPCHTLNYYARNSSFLLSGRENVSLLFLSGTHSSEADVFATNIGHLTLTAINESKPRVWIMNTSILIVSTSSLTLAYIGLYSSQVKADDVRSVTNHELVCNETMISITSAYMQHVSLTMSSLFNSSWLINYVENTDFIDFENVTADNLSTSIEVIDTNVIGSSGSIDITMVVSKTSVVVNMRDCFFLETYVFSIKVNQTKANTLYDNEVSVEIHNCHFIESFEGFLITSFLTNQIFLLVSGCLFLRTQGNSLFLSNSMSNMYVTIEDTIFKDAQNAELDAIELSTSFSLLSLSFNSLEHIVFLRNISFINNTLVGGAVTIAGPANYTIDSCLFDGNSGFISGVIISDKADLTFSGNTTFSNNRGVSAGAVYLSQSTMWFKEGLNLLFNQNTANMGGAVVIEESRTSIVSELTFSAFNPMSQCFYQLTFDDFDLEVGPPVSVTFENNFAAMTRNDIFGASLRDRCTITPNRSIASHIAYDRIFRFLTPTLSPVSSSPRRVCSCVNNEPKCAEFRFISIKRDVIIGEKFNVSVMLVGEDFGTVSGGVFAAGPYRAGARPVQLSEYRLGDRQNIQQVSSRSTCTPLEYSIQSTNNQNDSLLLFLSTSSEEAEAQLAANFVFSADVVENSIKVFNRSGLILRSLLFTPMRVEINLHPCPGGFMLNNNTAVCDCDTRIRDFVASCVVMYGTGFLCRIGTNWIGTLNPNDTAITYHHACAFDYCDFDQVCVDLHHPDSQCALNHSGVLCGGCPPGLSLAIGSSRCLDCPDNNGVALLLVFVVAGIVLVLLIKIFDLTVAHGTINGLVFYANVIWINQAIFFPVNKNNDLNVFFQFLRVFIAWINLDFGIQTCFIQGLNAFWKTCLQFLFPAYIWIIAGSIVVGCKYSTRLTKLFGKNAVPVLTTLYLISYAKILNTIASILGFAVLRQLNKDYIKWVWLMDGNIPYVLSAHGFLFVTALFVLVVLWLPYTTILLFIQLLPKLPCAFVAKFMSRVRPLVDTYTGPLKVRHQYWVGLSLLARVVLAIVAFASQGSNPQVNIVFVTLISVVLGLLVAHVYKKLPVYLLELSFLFNLCVTSIIFLSTSRLSDRVITICVSVGISFVTFSAILLYHIVSRFIDFSKNRSGNQQLVMAKKAKRGDFVVVDDFVTVTNIDLREVMLETTNDL